MNMNTRLLTIALFMATLSLSAQTSNDDITLTAKDFGLASISTDIQSAEKKSKE